ncbi:MAG: hypothetical protein IKT41_05395 [Clostridia bacterium]|nr:hypothetical protein [Clostridia bacterium]
MKGYNKQTKKIEVLENFEQVEGTNPTQEITVLGKDGQKIDTKTPIAMYRIKGAGMEELITISKGEMEYKDISYCRRGPNNEYISTTVSQKNGVDRDDTSFEVREMMDDRITSNDELTKNTENMKKLQDMEKQQMPDDINITIDGIQITDIIKGKELMVDRLVKNTEYNYNKEEATKIVDNIVDEGMDFDKAREEIDSRKQPEQKAKEGTSTREPGGFGPWDNPRDRRGF